MKIRKKPILFDAWILDSTKEKPDWVQLLGTKLRYENNIWICESNTGTSTGQNFDVLIKDIKGDCYICKRSIFDITYDIISK